MGKPDTYTWEEWFKFANQQFMHSQKISIEEQQKKEALRKQQVENDRKLAVQLAQEMAKNLLPDLNLDFGSETKVDEPVGLASVKTEPGVDTVVPDTHNEQKKEKTPIDENKEKILELTEETKRFIYNLSDLFADKDVLLGLKHLKSIGEKVRAETSDETKNRLQPIQLNFGQDVTVKTEKDSFSSPRARSMFPGAKRTSFETFQEAFSNKRRKTSASPARAGKSPRHGGAGQSTPKSMTDAKLQCISYGMEFLKKKKTNKVAQALWNEVNTMDRDILEFSSTNFYVMMSMFNENYNSVPNCDKARSFKEEFFDYILANIEFTKVRSVIKILFHLMLYNVIHFAETIRQTLVRKVKLNFLI